MEIVIVLHRNRQKNSDLEKIVGIKSKTSSAQGVPEKFDS